MTNWVMVLLTLIIAFFTYLVWKVYERIAWLTGAMETHSDLMLRIEASRGIGGTPIKLLWWDPTIEPPPVTREHGQEIDLAAESMPEQANVVEESEGATPISVNPNFTFDRAAGSHALAAAGQRAR